MLNDLNMPKQLLSISAISLLTICLFWSPLSGQSGLTVVLEGDSLSCYGDQNGTVQAFPSNGIEPYQFLWNSGDTTASVTELGAGMYAVTVTDASGISAVDSVAVAEPPELTGIVVFGNPTCPGIDDGQASALPQGGSPPYTYQWSDSQMQTTKVATGLASGFYFVTVTDAAMCSVVLFVALYDKTVIDPVVVGTDAGCLGVDGSVTVDTVVGGFPPYTYIWDSGDTTATVNNLSPGQYTVTVTDSIGCFGADSVEVGLDTLIELQIIAPNTPCGSDTGFAELVINGEPPYTVVINGIPPDTVLTQADTVILDGLVPGDYSVTVVDNRFCSVTQAFSILQNEDLLIDISTVSDTCGNETGAIFLEPVLGVGPFTYEWSPAISDSAAASNLPAGEYGVTVTDDATGCTIDTILTITQINPLNVSFEADSASCPGKQDGAITLFIDGGTAPYSIQWSVDSLQGNALIGLSAGTYGVTVTDAQGCLRDTIVLLGFLDTLNTESVITDIRCHGDSNGSVQIVGTGGTEPYHYQWSTGDTLAQLSGLGGGEYQVTVSDANGCSTEQLIVVDENAPLVIDADVTPEGCGATGNGVIQVSVSGGVPPYSYQWSVPGAPDTTLLSGLESGAYELTVTDLLGCLDSMQIVLPESQTPDADFMAEYDPCTRDSILLTLTDLSTQNGDSTTLDKQWFVNGDFESADSTWVYITDTTANLEITLIVTNSDGCQDTATQVLLLTPIEVPLPDSVPICLGDTVQLNVGAPDSYVYSWSPVFALDNPGSASPFAFPEASTTFQVDITVVQGVDTCQLVDSIFVRVADSFNLVIPADTTICDAWIGLGATSNAAVNFVWTNVSGDTLATGPGVVVTPEDTTVVIITASDQFGCTLTDSVQVVEGAVDISVDSAVALCLGESQILEVINLDPSDTLIFQWVPIGFFDPDTLSSVDFTADSAGTFQFAVTTENQYGCQDSAVIQALVIDTISGDGGLYFGQCEPLEVIFVNPGAPYYTLFFGNPTDPDAASNEAQTSYIYPDTGTYTAFLVLDSALGTSCIDTVFFEVMVQDGPFLIPGFSFSGGGCSDSVTVFFEDQTSHPQDSVVSWEWILGGQDTILYSSNPVYSVSSSPLIVTLNVTTALGCTGSITDTLEFPLVVADLPDTLIICRGDTVALNPGGNPAYSWSWSPAIGLSDTASINPLAYPDQTTTYTAEVSFANQTDTCRISQTTTVVVREGPVFTVPDDVTLCTVIDTLLAVSSSSNLQYVWATDPGFTQIVSTTAEVVANPANHQTVTYYIKAFDAEGCEAIDSVTVGNYALDVLLSDSLLICYGDTIVLEAVNLAAEDTLSYLWEFDESILSGLDSASILLSPLNTQSYSVEVTNQFGCKLTDTVLVIVDDFELTLQAVADPSVILPGGSSQLGVEGGGPGALVFAWRPPDNLDAADIQTPVASPDSTTEYIVEVVNANGCIGLATVVVTVELPPCDDPYIFLPNAFSPDDNGVNDELLVRGEHIETMLLEIYNRWGQLVFRSTDQSIGWDGTFKGRPAPQEVYGFLLEANCPGGQQYKKQGNITLLR